jgi:hypothetical protein
MRGIPKPIRPLTTTNSLRELTMANANLKPRSPRQRTHACVTLRDSPDYGPAQHDGPSGPFLPWMQIADVWLRQAGFTPGQRMRITFDCRNASLTITPDFG